MVVIDYSKKAGKMQISTCIRNIIFLLLIWLIVLWFDLPSLFNHLMLRGNHHQTHQTHHHNATDGTTWTIRDVAQMMSEDLSEDSPMPTVQHWTPPNDDPSIQYPSQQSHSNRIRRGIQQEQEGLSDKILTTTTIHDVSSQSSKPPPPTHPLPKITPILPLKPVPIPPKEPKKPKPGKSGEVPPNHLFPSFPPPKASKKNDKIDDKGKEPTSAPTTAPTFAPSKVGATTAPSALPTVRPSKGPKEGKNPTEGKNGKYGKGKVTIPDNKGKSDPKGKGKEGDHGKGKVPLSDGRGRGKHQVYFKDPPFHCEFPTAAPTTAPTLAPVVASGSGINSGGSSGTGSGNGIGITGGGGGSVVGGSSGTVTTNAGTDGTSSTPIPIHSPSFKPNTRSPTTPTRQPSTSIPSIHTLLAKTNPPFSHSSFQPTSTNQPTAYPTTYFYGSGVPSASPSA